MNKHILIIWLLIFNINLIISAERDTVRNYNLGEVVITSKEGAIENSASIIKVNENEISQRRMFSTDEVFHYLPGIFIRRSSRNESVLNIRGYNQREISIFLDGVPISTVTFVVRVPPVVSPAPAITCLLS